MCLGLSAEEMKAINAEMNSESVSSMPGWKFKDNGGGGDCFYKSLAAGFNEAKLCGKITWNHVDVREILTGTRVIGKCNMSDEVYKVPQKFPVIIALVQLTKKHETARYKYYFAENGATIEKDFAKETPANLPLIKLAFTGGHYMTVEDEPLSKKPTK
jgi:hypothetical protein